MRNPKTAQMRQMEREHGRSIEDIIIAAIDECGTAQDAAAKLGLRPSTLSVWMMRLNIRIRTVASLAS